MSEKKKKPSNAKPVGKPFLRGTALDTSCVGGALKFCLYLVMMGIAFLFIGAVLSFDSFALRVIINGALILLMLMILFQAGSVSGTVAVNAGELAYQRKESGRMLNQAEINACYHPVKGFLTALIGSIPLIAAATALALRAQRQMTSIGALPSWVTALQGDVDTGAGLALYAQRDSLTAEMILRLIIRSCLMPVVSIIGANNKDAMLLMEQLSPLLCCLPMIAYGLGYTQGVRVRAMVHANIALGKKKAKKKANKERKARAQQPRGPEQLN